MTKDIEKLKESLENMKKAVEASDASEPRKSYYDIQDNQEYIRLREEVTLRDARKAVSPAFLEWAAKMDAAKLAWHENAPIHTEMCREHFARSNELHELQVKEQARTADAFERIAAVLEHIATR